jgi:hypothetical protein
MLAQLLAPWVWVSPAAFGAGVVFFCGGCSLTSSELNHKFIEDFGPGNITLHLSRPRGALVFLAYSRHVASDDSKAVEFLTALLHGATFGLFPQIYSHTCEHEYRYVVKTAPFELSCHCHYVSLVIRHAGELYTGSVGFFDPAAIPPAGMKIDLGDALSDDALVQLRAGNSLQHTFTLQGKQVAMLTIGKGALFERIGVTLGPPARATRTASGKVVYCDHDLLRKVGRIAAVWTGSPADKAGLKPGDVLRRINRIDCSDGCDLIEVAKELVRPGASMTCEFQRQTGETVSLQLPSFRKSP